MFLVPTVLAATLAFPALSASPAEAAPSWTEIDGKALTCSGDEYIGTGKMDAKRSSASCLEALKKKAPLGANYAVWSPPPGGNCYVCTIKGAIEPRLSANKLHISFVAHNLPPPPPPPPVQWLEWPSKVPTGKGYGGGSSPFTQSRDLTGFEYWGGGANIVAGTGSDTWYPSWSTGGDLYTTFTDGGVTDSATKKLISSMSCGPCRNNNGSNITQGFARVAPSKPTSPIESGVTGVVDVATFESSALPYQGRYPSGNLFYKGVWYYGTYSLAELHGNAQYPCGNWCVQGPFIGFRHSLDKGKNWTEPRMEMAKDFSSCEPPLTPLFYPSSLPPFDNPTLLAEVAMLTIWLVGFHR